MFFARRPRPRCVTLGLMLACACAGACERPTAEPPAPAPAREPAPAQEPAPAPVPVEVQPSARMLPEPATELPEIEGLAYLEVVTGGADPESPLPMVVAFHGNTAYPGLMAWALLETSDDAGATTSPFSAPARFIFPRGVEAYGAPGHARWWGITANGAQTDAEELATLVTAMNEVSDQVASALEALAAQRPTLGKPIITGHSQGGILTFGLALRHSEHFAAALPAAGWLPEPLWPTQRASGPAAQLPIISFHGDADTVVSYVETTRGIEALTKLGYAVEAHSYAGVAHSLTPLLADLRAEIARRLPAK